MKKNYILFFTLLLVVATYGQTTVFQENFETGNSGATSEDCNDGYGDFFTRTDGSDISSSYTVIGKEGTYFFAAQDTDGSPCTSAVQTLEFSSINIASYTDMSFVMMVAEDDSSDGNEDWDTDSNVLIEINIDGAGYVNLMQFSGGGSSNTEPGLDTDFDGVADGTPLTPTFETFTAPVPVGNTADIRITFNNLNSGDEDIALDDIRIIDGYVPSSQTKVSFTTDYTLVSENIGTVDVCVSITNPHATTATTVDINIDGASTSTNGADYSAISFPKTITFPAGSTTDQCLTFTITDDSDIEPSETILLTLENPSGGDNAILDAGITHNITISASDAICGNVGDVIFTEIMQNPMAPINDSEAEWFELYNTTGSDIDLQAWRIQDDNNPSEGFDIPNSLIIPAGGYLLFANNGDSSTNGNLPTPDFVYVNGFPFLGNGTDGITIQCSGTIIDSVIWDNGATFPDPNGASMSLMMTSLNSVDNDNGANWEVVTYTYGSQYGTPGGPNDTQLSVIHDSIEGFMIYPNPVNNKEFNIRSLSNLERQVQIFDLLGKTVYSKEIRANESVKISDLNSGIYILKVSEDGKTATRKLVVE